VPRSRSPRWLFISRRRLPAASTSIAKDESRHQPLFEAPWPFPGTDRQVQTSTWPRAAPALTRACSASGEDGCSVGQSALVVCHKGGNTFMSAVSWAFRHLSGFVRRSFGIHMYRQLPRGVDPFADIAAYLPNTRSTEFTMLARMMARSRWGLHRRFPGAEIHCFEPVKATFNRLLANLQTPQDQECCGPCPRFGPDFWIGLHDLRRV
jgi:hypothetical protein